MSLMNHNWWRSLEWSYISNYSNDIHRKTKKNYVLFISVKTFAMSMLFEPNPEIRNSTGGGNERRNKNVREFLSSSNTLWKITKKFAEKRNKNFIDTNINYWFYRNGCPHSTMNLTNCHLIVQCRMRQHTHKLCDPY